jgi:hypothetical protein
MQVAEEKERCQQRSILMLVDDAQSRSTRDLGCVKCSAVVTHIPPNGPHMQAPHSWRGTPVDTPSRCVPTPLPLHHHLRLEYPKVLFTTESLSYESVAVLSPYPSLVMPTKLQTMAFTGGQSIMALCHQSDLVLNASMSFRYLNAKHRRPMCYSFSNGIY